MTGSENKVLLFECNEIPWRVIDRYVAANPDSHVARVFAKGKQYETVCEDQIELDPWISWPTLHRGVIDEQHRIFHLGQSLEQADTIFPPVWHLLANEGFKVGIMGSLHTSTLPPSMANYAFYVPDVFSSSDFAHPPRLKPFQAFNLAMTRRSARNVDTGIAWKEALRFVASYAFSGLSLSTIKVALSELWSELRMPHLKCRRRAVQPMIALDIFLREMARSKPDFATFHTNHVAAAMHRFWAATFPDDEPGNEMPDEWYAKYRHEIDYSMDVFDTMLGRLAKFVEGNSGYRLVLATSLGQAAVKTVVAKGFYTVVDIDRFMARLGFGKEQWKQRFAMVPCLSVVIDDDHANAFEARLAGIRVDNHIMLRAEQDIAPLSYSRAGRSFQLFFCFDDYRGSKQAQIEGEVLSFAELGMGYHEHQDDVGSSGRHTPFGSLLVYDPDKPTADRSRARISSLDFAPALLHMYGLRPPAYMNAPDPAILDTTRPGRSVQLQIEGGGVEVPVTRLHSPARMKLGGAPLLRAETA